jgi:hypothetical protein
LSGIPTHDPSNQPAKTHASDRTAIVTGMAFIRASNNSIFHWNNQNEHNAVVKKQLIEREQRNQASFQKNWSIIITMLAAMQFRIFCLPVCCLEM